LNFLGWGLIAFWVLFSRRFTGIDPDLFWHLKCGQLILQDHQIAGRDVFSWTAPGAAWLNQEWGGQVLIAWLYGLGGLNAIELFHWLLFSLTALLATRIFTRAGLPLHAAAAAAVVLHFLLYGQTVFRMQNFTAAGLLVTAYVLQTWWLTGRVGRAGWAFPALMILWANIHGGGAIAGAVSCGIVLVAEAAASLRTGRWRPLIGLAGLTFAAASALLFNPAGFQLPAYSLAILTDPAVKAANLLVMEWRPFDLKNINYRLFLLALASVAVFGLVARRRPPLGMVALAFAWAAMAMMSRRNLALAPIALAPLAAFWLAGARVALAARPWQIRTAAVTAMAASGITLVSLSPPFHRTDLSSVPPYPSAGALRAAVSLGRTHPMLNFYEWGGIFIFVGHPQTKVFIDGRSYHYGARMMREYNEMMNLAPGWRETLARHGAELVVAPPFIGLVLALSQDPAWRVAFSDDTAIVVVRRTPALRPAGVPPSH
jgi:hypothetical protein